jgi:hypothetical protein
MPFLEEVNERRAEERRVDDRRKAGRRNTPAVKVSSFYEPEPATEPAPSVRKSVNVTFGPRISSQVSNQEIDRRMNDFLDRLLEKAGPKPEPKPLSDAELLALLTTESTLMFANSKPCWEHTEQVKAVGAGASE